MASRILALVIWAAVAASLVFWLLRLAGTSRPVPPHTIAVGENLLAGGDLSRLFGRDAAAPAEAAPAPAESPIKLIGVVAPREGSGLRAGVALLSVEGKPPRPYRVGAAVDADLVLLGVHQRGASLGPRDGAATMKLELAPLPAPNTGTLEAAEMPQDPAAAPVAPGRRPAPRLPVAVPPQQPPAEQPQGEVEAPEPGQRQPMPGDRPTQ